MYVRTLPILIILLIFVAACVKAPSTVQPAGPAVTAASTAAPSATAVPAAAGSIAAGTAATARPTLGEIGGCVLTPVVAPTMPATIPAYTELDTATGLHMTGKPQVIDLLSYRLKVSGKVDRPLSLSYDDLRCMPKITATPVLVCLNTFTDKATWSGVPIKEVLDRAGVQEGAKTVELTSADGFQMPIPLKDALDPKNYLAYEWEGQPLPVLHGFPLRAVFPEKLGSNWVKWLVGLVVE